MLGFGGTAKAGAADTDLAAELDLEPARPAAKPDDGRCIWESDDTIPWERDLLTLFVNNQLRVSLALPFLAALLALTSLLWTEWTAAGAWLGCALGCQGVQLYFCRMYNRSDKKQERLTEWIGILAATEFFYASCWSLPLYTFWESGNDLQHIYLIATLMAVVAVRIMIASNFMPIVIAGTGFITFNIVVRCIIEAQPLYIALGAIAVIAEVFFIQLARRLQATARDMLIFKSQRERLITELEQAKNQANYARDRAEDANRAKSRFLATMSHELRTPLNAIMGFSEILSDELMGPHAVPAYKDYSTDIHQSGNYLLTLINDILDLSRIEAGRHELRTEPVDVVQQANKSLKLIEFKAREKNHTIKVFFPPAVPRLSGDSRAVRQIWLNLLSNAVKFTPDGGEIALKVERLEDRSLVISVQDNGPGIPSEEINTALGAFSRGTLATRDAIDGAGLGLPIVHGLIKLHGGEMHIRSKVGEGTEVRVSFPAKQVLDGTRAEIISAAQVESESQRRLIAVTA